MRRRVGARIAPLASFALAAGAFVSAAQVPEPAPSTATAPASTSASSAATSDTAAPEDPRWIVVPKELELEELVSAGATALGSPSSSRPRFLRRRSRFIGRRIIELLTDRNVPPARGRQLRVPPRRARASAGHRQRPDWRTHALGVEGGANGNELYSTDLTPHDSAPDRALSQFPGSAGRAAGAGMVGRVPFTGRADLVRSRQDVLAGRVLCGDSSGVDPPDSYGAVVGNAWCLRIAPAED